MSETRLKEFEALRGLSILLLLALHSEIFDPYVFGQALKDIGFFVASFLLGSFFFLAGYFTEVSLSKPGITVFQFVWSKFIRIYPPYWLALFLFIFVLEYDLNRTALAVLSLVLVQLTLNMGLPATNLIYLLVSDLFILCWILLVLTGFRTKVGNWGIWAWLSTASFFAYLIHRPLWRVIDNYFELEPGHRTVMIHLIPGAIVALILGYLLQRGYDRLLIALRLK